MNKASFKTIGSLFDTEKTFVIPNYQRGYKWAVQNYKNGIAQESHLQRLLHDLWNAFKNYKSDYFLQGITVFETGNEIILIDGQQRITSLYLIKWTLYGKENISNIYLKYDVGSSRNSGDFINKLKLSSLQDNSEIIQHANNEEQDIYYFKQAINQIIDFKKNKEGEEKNSNIFKEFISYIDEKVRIIYITIDDENKAVRTFTMMNGSKANMLPEELIKAEMLRKISLPLKNKIEVSSSLNDGLEILRTIVAKDWETSALRSKYAREWDKWLYWWNRREVQDFFGTNNNPMGLLLNYYFRKKIPKVKDGTFSFRTFKSHLLDDEYNEVKKTKETYKELRDFQKRFEDLYNDPISYNWLGLSLKCDSGNEKYEIIMFFIDNNNDHAKEEYYAKRKIVSCTDRQIRESLNSRVMDKQVSENYDYNIQRLNSVLDEFVYLNNPGICFKFLYYLNIKEDNELRRKFDFHICDSDKRTLEHIYAKADVYHITDDGKYMKNDSSGNDIDCTSDEVEEIKKESDIKDNSKKIWLNRLDIEERGEKICGKRITEHSIGNIVLLYREDNSSFNKGSYDEKKGIFFNVTKDHKVPSRHLLHTISKFAGKYWREKEIVEYYKEVMDIIKDFYNEN